MASGLAPALAQNIQYTRNATDPKLRGGLRVNPSTLALEFQIALGSYPGRAGLDVPVTISYSSKVWRVAYQGYNPGQYTSSGQPIGNGYTMVGAIYGEYSRSGWASSLGTAFVDTWSNTDVYDQFGNATGNNCPQGCYAVDRVFAHMPDGSVHELRSSDQPSGAGAATPDDLYAVDGSRLRYQRSTQTLFLPDGSRYINGQYVDRNGNLLAGGSNALTDR